MPSFAEALRILNELKADGAVEDYAVAGAMALLFWTEPIPTFDPDVLVFPPGEQPAIVSLTPLYRWLAKRGFAAQAEHVMIHGVPVQFLPAHDRLAEEAVERAATLEYESVQVRVVRPEYLVALYQEPGARTLKRRERAAALRESGALDQTDLDGLLKRFGLEF